MTINQIIEQSYLNKKINVTIIAADYVPIKILGDLALSIHTSLSELGFESQLTHNVIYREKDVSNIIFCPHLMHGDDVPLVNKKDVIVNMEQIRSWQTHENDWFRSCFHKTLYLASKCQVWDYSHKNIELFKSLGINHIRYWQIGYSPALKRIEHKDNKDIDVLFYGAKNPRREIILNELIKKGFNAVYLFGVFGEELDNYISRSRIVLNIHHYTAEIFEIARCSYLMNNGVAVVSEVNHTTSVDEVEYLYGLAAVPYHKLVDKCCELLNNPEMIVDLQKKALETLQRFPQTELIKTLLLPEENN